MQPGTGGRATCTTDAMARWGAWRGLDCTPLRHLPYTAAFLADPSAVTAWVGAPLGASAVPSREALEM